MKTLVLGLGNPLLRDDSVGLRVVRVLRHRLPSHPSIDVDEDCWGGLRLMERMVGFDQALVIDAATTGAPPGTVRTASPRDFRGHGRHCASAHDVSLPQALDLGRKAGAALPADELIRLVMVEAAEVLSFGERCTPAVEAAIPRAVDAAWAELRAWRLVK